MLIIFISALFFLPLDCLRLQMSTYLGKNPVFVAGGSKGVGLEIIKQLSALGTPVRALVRQAESKDMLEKLPGVQAFIGNAFDEDSVQSTMTGCVAAITTLGGKDANGKRVDYMGNSNVVEQAGILGCERIILVTSIGCGPTREAVSPQVYKVLEEAIVEKNKAERDLRMYTNLDWTIIRPGGLKSDAATGKAILTDDITKIGSINRADVATLVIKALGTDKTYTRKEYSAIDPSLTGF